MKPPLGHLARHTSVNKLMSGLGKSEIHILASLVSNSGLCMNWATELGAGIYFTIFAIPTLKRIAQSEIWAFFS